MQLARTLVWPICLAACSDPASVQSAAKDDDPLNEAEDSAWGQYFKDREAYEQIQRDVERTHQSVPFFSSDSPAACEHRQVRHL